MIISKIPKIPIIVLERFQLEIFINLPNGGTLKINFLVYSSVDKANYCEDDILKLSFLVECAEIN